MSSVVHIHSQFAHAAAILQNVVLSSQYHRPRSNTVVQSSALILLYMVSSVSEPLNCTRITAHVSLACAAKIMHVTKCPDAHELNHHRQDWRSPD